MKKYTFTVTYKEGSKFKEDQVWAESPRDAAFKFRQRNNDAEIKGIRKC